MLAISLDISGAKTRGRQRSGKQIRDTKSQHQANAINHPKFHSFKQKKKSIIDFTGKHNAFADLWMGANPPST